MSTQTWIVREILMLTLMSTLFKCHSLPHGFAHEYLIC